MSEAKFTPHYLLENLRDIYFAERSGALMLKRGSAWRRLYFERGMVALADSSVPQENLPAILREMGAAVAPDAAATKAAPVLARELLAGKKVDPSKLEQAARLAVETAVNGAFRWDGGTFLFEEGEVGAPAFAPDVLFTFEVFQRGVQEMANFEPLRELLVAEERKLRLNDNAFLPIESLNLGVEQGYILSRVDGTLSVRDVAMLAPEGTEERVLRMLFGFLVLGLVLYDPPPGEGMFSLRKLMEDHRGDRKRVQGERTRVLEFYEGLRERSPEEILGVRPGSGPKAIKGAYEALRERYRKDRFSSKLRTELKRELGIIENRLLECYLQMQSEAIEQMTPSSRVEEEMPSADFEKRKELVKSAAQTTEEENQKLAEKYFLKAKDYFRDGDYFNCIQFCKLAVKFNGREAPFFSLMADALLKNPDHRWQRLAEESYLKAVEIDPWNADYLVSLGRLYKRQGLVRRARRQFEKALEIVPNHASAGAEIRDL